MVWTRDWLFQNFLMRLFDKQQMDFVFIHPAQIPSVEKMMDLIPVEDRPGIDEFLETLDWEHADMAF